MGTETTNMTFETENCRGKGKKDIYKWVMQNGIPFSS